MTSAPPPTSPPFDSAVPPPSPPPRRRRWIAVLVVVSLVVTMAGAGAVGIATWWANRPSTVNFPPPSSVSPTPRPPGAMPDRPLTLMPASPTGFIDLPPGLGLDRYLNQTIDWWTCADGEAECADIAVPLDYANPDDQAITLAILRRPPAGDGQLGPLFVNPGGPGAPGRGAALWFDPETLPDYQLVSWDPRGAGESTPVVCDADLDQLRAHDASPDTAEEEEALIEAWRDFGQVCAAGSGRLLEHIGTTDTVADLELLRRLLGGQPLNYLGFSYGTYIGAVYADLYPERVGRMVLDSPVNITGDESIDQIAGFNTAFARFAQWCVDNRCPLSAGRGPDADTIVAETIAFFHRLDAEPLEVDGRWLTQTLALDGVALYLYGAANVYPDLAEALDQALSGDGAGLLWASDIMWERDDDGSYSTLLSAFTAIRCRDATDDGVRAAFTDWHEQAEDDSLFGLFGGPDLPCTVWPVLAEPPQRPVAAGAAPILVVGSTGDAATPFQFAQWMAEQMPSTVLLTYDGPGHATYGGRNSCIDQAVNAYLNDGRLPASGKICR